eukprot:255985-Hanusia_phi.AAC.1
MMMKWPDSGAHGTETWVSLRPAAGPRAVSDRVQLRSETATVNASTQSPCRGRRECSMQDS